MNLMQLVIKNQQAKRDYRIVNSGKEATVYLYDVIGDDYYGGISAKQFVADIAALDVDVIHLRFNSPGGDVFAARAMATGLSQVKAKTIAHIDGHAASAATYIALSCSEVLIAPGAFFMVHNAWTYTAGNANDLDAVAALLRKVDASISADYAKKTGAAAQRISDWMDAETWFTAEEAVQHGFADSIEESAPAAKNQWDLSAYRNAPSALTNSSSNDEIQEPDREMLYRRLALLERIAA